MFDEVFTPYLLDETDYCMRTKKAGFKLVSRTDIKIVHYKGVTINRDTELKRNYVRLKNDIIFSLINSFKISETLSLSSLFPYVF